MSRYLFWMGVVLELICAGYALGTGSTPWFWVGVGATWMAVLIARRRRTR